MEQLISEQLTGVLISSEETLMWLLINILSWNLTEWFKLILFNVRFRVLSKKLVVV